MKKDATKDVVLVVEDEFLVRLDTADILADGGFDVVEAGDAEEALEILAHTPEVSVLFTDVNLPGMDGIRLVERVQERWPHIRVLVTSGHARPSRDSIPGRFIGKPYMPDKMVATVRDLLQN